MESLPLDSSGSAPGTADTPELSIILPTFNCEATVGACLGSIDRQSFRDYELIVVDGCSSDGTQDVIAQYERSITTLISEPDNGVYDAMNKGIRAARGRWIYFLGSDDRLKGDAVLEQIFPIAEGTEFLYGNVSLIGHGIVGSHGQEYDGPFTRLKLCKKNVCQQAVFYHRLLFQELGLFEAKYPTLADWLFNIRVFARPQSRPRYVDTVIAEYHAEGRSHQQPDVLANRDRIRLIRQVFGWKYGATAAWYKNVDRVNRLVERMK